MGRRWWIAGMVFLCAAALVWRWRDTLLSAVLAARTHLAVSASLLLLLYMLKGLTAAVPLSALEAVGGMLFPLPGALALNTAGVALAPGRSLLDGAAASNGPDGTDRPLPPALALSASRSPARGAPSFCCGWAAPLPANWSAWLWAPPESPGGPTFCPDCWGVCPGWRPPPSWVLPCLQETPAGWPRLWPAAQC